MKAKWIPLIMIFGFTTAMAQDSVQAENAMRRSNDEIQTLFSKGIKNGGYGAPVLKLTHIDNQLALLVGGQGAWVIDHTFGFGLFGYGLASQVRQVNDQGEKLGMEMGYGGFLLEPILMSNYVVHVTFPIALGAGGVAYFENERFDVNYYYRDAEAFFIAEPGMNVELNMTRHLRFIMGGSYRFVSKMDLSQEGYDELEGASLFAGFKLGVF
ncbi:MAG: hypothetical protein KDD36_09895 [Flavobacteriales bacterium]|nr:hypothetical protein [Flavobacteriales bacterium]